jgi:hypothetical protein
MAFTVCLDMVKRRKFPSISGNLTPATQPVVSPFFYWLGWPSLCYKSDHVENIDLGSLFWFVIKFRPGVGGGAERHCDVGWGRGSLVVFALSFMCLYFASAQFQQLCMSFTVDCLDFVVYHVFSHNGALMWKNFQSVCESLSLCCVIKADSVHIIHPLRLPLSVS